MTWKEKKQAEFRVQAKDKLERLARGETIITNDTQMDLMIDIDNEPSENHLMDKVRFIHNNGRCGLLDQYEAWVGGFEDYRGRFPEYAEEVRRGMLPMLT